MTNEEFIEFLNKTPENVNPNIIRGILDQMEGGSVTIEPLSVIKNGTYAESGKAYSPVIANVTSDALGAYVLKSVNVNGNPGYYNEEESAFLKQTSLSIQNMNHMNILEQIDKIYQAIIDYNVNRDVTFDNLLKTYKLYDRTDSEYNLYFIIYFMEIFGNMSPSDVLSALSSNVNNAISNLTALVPQHNISSTFSEEMATMFYWMFVLLSYSNTTPGLNDSGVQDLISGSFTGRGAFVFPEMRLKITNNVDLVKLQYYIENGSPEDGLSISDDVLGFLYYLRAVRYNIYTIFSNYDEFENTDLEDILYEITGWF